MGLLGPGGKLKHRVLVCGSRTWNDYDAIYRALASKRDEIEVVIHGAARGADTLADRAAINLGLPVLAFPADWRRDGRSAGPIRNHVMLRKGKPDIVLAFSDNLDESHGTRHMLAIALRDGHCCCRLFSHQHGWRDWN